MGKIYFLPETKRDYANFFVGKATIFQKQRTPLKFWAYGAAPTSRSRLVVNLRRHLVYCVNDRLFQPIERFNKLQEKPSMLVNCYANCACISQNKVSVKCLIRWIFSNFGTAIQYLKWFQNWSHVTEYFVESCLLFYFAKKPSDFASAFQLVYF